jgi:hypothetical protein
MFSGVNGAAYGLCLLCPSIEQLGRKLNRGRGSGANGRRFSEIGRPILGVIAED